MNNENCTTEMLSNDQWDDMKRDTIYTFQIRYSFLILDIYFFQNVMIVTVLKLKI